ncbi:MAG: nicotinate-nucleotide adenylyltransferase [Bacillota bacterium]
MKFAIFGGTFDPVHVGHLIIAEQIYNNFSLDKVIFIPAKIPPHKNSSGITPAYHRVEMIRLAIADNPHFTYSELELGLPGKSYTVETLKALKKLGSEHSYSLILGADSLRDIFTWKQPYFILKNAEIIVARRPGIVLEEVFKDERLRPFRKDIKLLDNILIDLSSSQIRELLDRGQSIKYLIPEQVEDYIKDTTLYRGD